MIDSKELADYLCNHMYEFGTGTFWYLNREELEKVIQNYLDTKV